MGRVKDMILDEEAKDWVQEQQKKIISKMHENIGYMYSSMIDFDLIEDKNLEYIEFILKGDDTKRKIYPENIQEIDGVSIKYDPTAPSFREKHPQYAQKSIRIIPILNILYMDYVFKQ